MKGWGMSEYGLTEEDMSWEYAKLKHAEALRQLDEDWAVLDAETDEKCKTADGLVFHSDLQEIRQGWQEAILWAIDTWLEAQNPYLSPPQREDAKRRLITFRSQVDGIAVLIPEFYDRDEDDDVFDEDE